MTRTGLAAGVLAVATIFLILRLPGSVTLMAVAPLVSLLLTGVHRPRSGTGLLAAFLGFSVVSAGVGVFINPAGLSLVNFATLAVVFTMFSIAVVASGSAQRMSSVVMKTVFWSFAFALVVGLGEIITGFKLQTVLYPQSSNLQFADRFMVAAWFPNYNDFAVVITMFALMTLIRFLFESAAGRGAQIGRAMGYLVATAVIVAGGSRGALVSLLVGSALVIVQAVRIVRPRLVTALWIICGVAALVILAAALWVSPWVQDNSTSVREGIIGNTLAMTPDNSPMFWFGWGDVARFQAAAQKNFPNVLMDPHNLLLEVFTWFGLPSLVAFVLLWVHVTWKGLWRVELTTNWVGTAAVILFALTPVLGIVPSSPLRYYYLFIIAPCAISFLESRRPTPVEED